MIQVQIASQVSTTGVEGVRWVLVDDAGAADAVPEAPALRLAAADGPARVAAEREHWSLGLLKAGVLGLCMGAALWAGQAWLGPVTAPALAGTPVPAAAPGDAARPAPAPAAGLDPQATATPAADAASAPALGSGAAPPTSGPSGPPATAPARPASAPTVTAEL